MSEIQEGAEAAQRLVALFRGLGVVGKALDKIGSFEQYEKEVEQRVVNAKGRDDAAKAEIQRVEKILLELMDKAKKDTTALAESVRVKQAELRECEHKIAEARRSATDFAAAQAIETVRMTAELSGLTKQVDAKKQELMVLDEKIEKKTAGLAALAG